MRWICIESTTPHPGVYRVKTANGLYTVANFDGDKWYLHGLATDSILELGVVEYLEEVER